MKRQMSIPADRASLVDNMDYDVISYGGGERRSKAGSKPGVLKVTMSSLCNPNALELLSF
jgi:hypothetical protein